MKVECDLKPIWETWSDPGDYPSGAGGAPLPTTTYVGGLSGSCRFEFAQHEIAPSLEDLIEEAYQHVPYKLQPTSITIHATYLPEHVPWDEVVIEFPIVYDNGYEPLED